MIHIGSRQKDHISAHRDLIGLDGKGGNLYVEIKGRVESAWMSFASANRESSGESRSKISSKSTPSKEKS